MPLLLIITLPSNSLKRHPLPYTFEAIQLFLVIFVLEPIPPTRRPCSGDPVKREQDAAVVPAQKAGVAAAAEEVVDFGAH